MYFSGPSFSIRNQTSRTVKYHIHASEMASENMDMLITIKIGNHDLPCRYEKQLLLDLKGYMYRSKLN